MRRTMGSHHSSRMVTDVWLTPRRVLDALGSFDLDPCAAPPPRPWPTAARHICLPQDGLSAPWEGRVWLNPPYSREAVRWLDRIVEHGRGTALVFARTETEWFVRTVWSAASAVRFVHGRLTFCRADGSPAGANSGAPSVLVAYGDTDAEVLRVADIAGGTYVDLRGITRHPGG